MKINRFNESKDEFWFCCGKRIKTKFCPNCGGTYKKDSKPEIKPDFTNEEKIKAFDIIQKSCLEHANSVLDGDNREDDDHYIYEAAMQQTLGKDIFTVLNPYFR